MFIIDMIIMTITSNIGLIVASAIILASFAIAIWGQSWLEAKIAKNPEWWLEERDMSLKAILERRKNK